MSAWTCRQTARPPERLLHPVFEPHHGRASGADSGEKHEPAGDIDAAAVASLEALDPGRPIREADIRVTRRQVCFGPDSVEKVLCGEHAEFLKAADDLDGFERGGPRQPKQNRSAVFLP